MNFREFLINNLNEDRSNADEFKVYAGIVEPDYAFAVVEYNNGKIVNVHDLVTSGMVLPDFNDRTNTVDKIKNLYSKDVNDTTVQNWLTKVIKFKNLTLLSTLPNAKSVRNFFIEFYDKIIPALSLKLQKRRNGIREQLQRRPYYKTNYLTERNERTEHKMPKNVKICDVFTDFDEFVDTAKQTIDDVA